MNITDPKTGITVNINPDPEILEMVQKRLEEIGATNPNYETICRALVHVCVERWGTSPGASEGPVKMRCWNKAVAGHFLGAA